VPVFGEGKKEKWEKGYRIFLPDKTNIKKVPTRRAGTYTISPSPLHPHFRLEGGQYAPQIHIQKRILGTLRGID
jgi:hypothetical protein